LEQVVVHPFSMKSEKKNSNNCTIEDLLKVGLVLFDLLSKETLSPDVLALTFLQAQNVLGKSMDNNKVEFILKKYAKLAEKQRSSNPISSMF
jgi:hypothetical protein